MRRWLLLVLVLLVVASIVWLFGGPGGVGGIVPHPREVADAGTIDDPQLRGRNGEGSAGADAEAPVAAPGDPPTAPRPTKTARVTGRIVGPDGQPVEGAEALALGELIPYGDCALYESAVADAEGFFALPVYHTMPLTVVATAPGYGITVGTRFGLVDGASADAGVLTLTPAGTIIVRVLDEQGSPVEGAYVEVEPEADPAPAGWGQMSAASGRWGTAFENTGADGRLVFQKLPPGDYRLLLDVDDVDGHDQVREHVPAGSAEVVFVVVRPPPRKTLRLTLEVLDPEGRPVPAGTARLEGPDGDCTITVDPGEPWFLDLTEDRGPIHLVVWNTRDANGSPLGFCPYVLWDVQPQEEPVVVRLEPGLAITGRVQWDGEPSRWQIDAETWIGADGRGAILDGPQSYTRPQLDFRVQTDASGAFRLAGLPPGVVNLRVEGPGRLPDSPLEVPAGTEDLEIRLEPAAALHLRVRAPAGHALGYAHLRVQRWHRDGLGPHRAHAIHSDPPKAELAVEISDLDPGADYRVQVLAGATGPPLAEFELAHATPRTEPYVVQLREGRHVRGQVVREDGSPVWGAQIYYRPWPGGPYHPNRQVEWRWLGSARTDRQGAFDLAGLGADDVLLAVEMVGLTTFHDPPRVPTGTSGHRIVVYPVRSISGRVVDPEGGRVDDLCVTAVPAEGVPRLWTDHEVAADGFFAVEGLGPGKYRVVVWNAERAEDLRCARSEPVAAGARDVRLTLHAGHLVEGVVRSPGGEPVGQAAVRLLGTAIHWHTFTDDTGRYGFSGVPSGPYQVEVVAPSGARQARTLRTATDGATTRGDVELPPR